MSALPRQCHLLLLLFCLLYYSSCAPKAKKEKISSQVQLDQNPPLTVRIKANRNNKYLSVRKADNALVANQDQFTKASWFEVVEMGNGNLALKAATGKYVSVKGPANYNTSAKANANTKAEPTICSIAADADQPAGPQTLQLQNLDSVHVAIKLYNGNFLQAEKNADSPLFGSPIYSANQGSFIIELNH